MKLEQAETENKIVELDTGRVQRKQATNKLLNERIDNVVQDMSS